MGTGLLAENTISVKNRSEVGSIVMSYVRDLDMTPSIFGHGLRKECLITSAKFQHDPPSTSVAISGKKILLGRVIPPTPSLSMWREG